MAWPVRHRQTKGPAQIGQTYRHRVTSRLYPLLLDPLDRSEADPSPPDAPRGTPHDAVSYARSINVRIAPICLGDVQGRIGQSANEQTYGGRAHAWSSPE